jgi:hypothetical protein
MGEGPEPMAVVPVAELRKLAELLRQMEVDLADDYVAGLASRMLRDLSRRWADTVSVWAVEAHLWEGEQRPARVPLALGELSPAELREVVREAAARLATLQGRPPAAVLAEIIQSLKGGQQ